MNQPSGFFFLVADVDGSGALDKDELIAMLSLLLAAGHGKHRAVNVQSLVRITRNRRRREGKGVRAR